MSVDDKFCSGYSSTVQTIDKIRELVLINNSHFQTNYRTLEIYGTNQKNVELKQPETDPVFLSKVIML